MRLAAQEASPAEAPRMEVQDDWPCPATPRRTQWDSSAREGPRTGAEALRHAHALMDEVQQEWGKTDAIGVAVATEPEVEFESLQAAGKKHVPKVAHSDLVEHELTRGSWEGIRAMHKGGEIHVGVSTHP